MFTLQAIEILLPIRLNYIVIVKKGINRRCSCLTRVLLFNYLIKAIKPCSGETFRRLLDKSA